MAQHVTDKDFEDKVLKSTLPVLVDFYAEWCGPCKAMAPIIDEIASEYEGKANVFKLNVDENQASAQKFAVMSIPTLIFFKDGEVAEQNSGTMPKTKIAEKLDALA